VPYTDMIPYISYLVFHGGSGSEKHEIKTTVDSGVVKMNVDTGNYNYTYLIYFPDFHHVDTQWAYLVGIRVSSVLSDIIFPLLIELLVDRTSCRRSMITSKAKWVIPKVQISPIRR